MAQALKPIKAKPGGYFKVDWNTDDPATPALVEALLADMGVGKDNDHNSQVAVEATKRWCVSEIQFYAGLGEVLSMGELNQSAFHFYDGYLTCLNDHQQAE